MDGHGRDYLFKSSEAFHVYGDRHNGEKDSKYAGKKQYTPEYIKKFLHFIFLILISLNNGFQEHPEGQHRGNTVDSVTHYRALAPGLFLATKHVRQYHDDSDQLEDTQKNGSNPPAHVELPPYMVFIVWERIVQYILRNHTCQTCQDNRNL
jgi:hypothetical protein